MAKKVYVPGLGPAVLVPAEVRGLETGYREAYLLLVGADEDAVNGYVAEAVVREAELYFVEPPRLRIVLGGVRGVRGALSLLEELSREYGDMALTVRLRDDEVLLEAYYPEHHAYPSPQRARRALEENKARLLGAAQGLIARLGAEKYEVVDGGVRRGRG